MATATMVGTDMEALKQRLRSTWMTGNYEQFARYMETDAEQFFARLGVRQGAKLLDVGCGAGQVALIAARSGVNATGCDIAMNWIEQARARASAQNLRVRFEEGDAEALPYADGEFDVVVSLVGAMFAPRPERVAAEMKRVCRSGGMIAMGNWTPGGFVGQMFKTIAKHIAPPGMPSPTLWGDEATVRERMREGIADLRMERRMYRFIYPFGPAEVVEFFRENYGPMSKAFAALDEQGQAKLRADLVELWSSHNQMCEGRTRVDSEYLEVVAIRA